ncbi:CREB binding [Paramuricea clavata]|uniref:histone acetyltransferase n=1 Tax=Paramuricea clavata TaxID=317549 RepID=A0A6S7I2Z6_PARCT|nr:CREB binding [Paramuricea clavata]
MKNVWKHFGACPENKKSSPKCPICNSVISLLHYHAKDCQNDSCTMPRCRELKDGFLAKWQKTQQTFLGNLVKFRLSTVPTVIKRQSKKVNTKSSVQTNENNLVSKPVTKDLVTIEN